jgi:hypothetical protein
MVRRIVLSVAGLLLAASTGCAICSSPTDYDYGAYGGRWDRMDRCRGRVGSAFEPAEIQITSFNPAESDGTPELVEPGDAQPVEPAPQPPVDETETEMPAAE